MSIYTYKGFGGCDSKCDLKKFQYNGKTILIFTELEDNEGTSITNMIEHLATQVINANGLDPANCVIVEHYPVRGKYREHIETWDLVSPDFSTGPKAEWIGHCPTDRYMWKRITLAEVNMLCGQQTMPHSAGARRRGGDEQSQ